MKASLILVLAAILFSGQQTHRLIGTVVLAPADSTAEPLDGLTITLRSTDGKEYSATSAKGGKIVIDRLPEGRYAVTLTGIPQDAAVVYALQGKRDIIKDGVEIGSTDAEISILLSPLLDHSSGGDCWMAVHNSSNFSRT